MQRNCGSQKKGWVLGPFHICFARKIDDFRLKFRQFRDEGRSFVFCYQFVKNNIRTQALQVRVTKHSTWKIFLSSPNLLNRSTVVIENKLELRVTTFSSSASLLALKFSIGLPSHAIAYICWERELSPSADLTFKRHAYFDRHPRTLLHLDTIA